VNPHPHNFASLQKLADRIHSGEVVFFIGAGFSLDSEGNTATRLMMRLLIRLQGIVTTLAKAMEEEYRRADQEVRQQRSPETVAAAEANRNRCAQYHEELNQLLENLRLTFKLRQDRPEVFPWTMWRRTADEGDPDLTILAREYYAANDWFCAAFERILVIFYAICGGPQFDAARCKSLLEAIHAEEERIRTKDKDAPLVPDPLTPIEPPLLRWAAETERPHAREAGKTLFLDTLGFADPKVMGGDPWSTEPETRDESYRGKLLPRHHVLARLAREGLCPVVLTTNYDLLLEGAWREAGFESADFDVQSGNSRNDLPATPWHRMARVGSPVEFMKYGKAVGTSLVLKVHGCVQLYRKLRKDFLERASNSPTAPGNTARAAAVDKPWSSLRAYLPSMVFTYREIQNWREDAWTQHYLATIQRTRTVAFVGYSLQDPVIHDAFRTVYEEMTRQWQSAAAKGIPGEDTRAFFFGSADEHSFHGNEVLIAATHAAGTRPDKSHDHMNYIRLKFRDRAAPSLGEFPNLDDQFLWMYHLASRELQRQCLQRELRTIATLLLPDSPGPAEIAAVIESFAEVIANERAMSVRWDSSAPISANRRQLERVAAWTYHFHAGLLREFACIDMVRRRHGPGWLMEQVRRRKWYYPLTANPCWTAWAVVVELAVRRTLTWLAGEHDPEAAWKPRTQLFHAVECRVPTVLFIRDTRQTEGPSLEALSLQTGSFDRVHQWPELNGAVGGRVLWRLSTNQTPWHRTKAGLQADQQAFARLDCLAPSAAEVWRAAHEIPEQGSGPTLKEFLEHKKVRSDA